MSEMTLSAAAPASAAAPVRPVSLGLRAVEAAYWLFVLSIPLETILYFQSDEHPDSTVSVARVVGILLFGLAFAQWRSCFKKIPAAFWMIAWYFAAFSLSQLYIPGHLFPKFHEAQVTLIQMTALFLLSYNLFLDERLRDRVLRLYGWWTVMVAVLMLSGVLGVQFASEGRESVLQQDPNVAAGMLTLGALCIMADPKLISADRKAARIVASAGGVVILLTAILRTGSRGGLLAFAVGVLALGLCAGKATRKARLAIMAAVLGLGGVMVAQEFARGTDTAARLKRTWEEGDTAGRTEIFDTAWTMFKQKPLEGYGGADNRFELGARLNFPDRDTHNTYLHILTEVGLLGGAPFLLALLEALRRSWKAGRKRGDALPFALMCSLLMINTSITGIREKLFWIVFAVAVAAS